MDKRLNALHINFADVLKVIEAGVEFCDVLADLLICEIEAGEARNMAHFVLRHRHAKGVYPPP